jgi:hypothetical protein
MSVVVVISQHLLNVFVQLENKRGLKKKFSVRLLLGNSSTNPPPRQARFHENYLGNEATIKQGVSCWLALDNRTLHR